MRRWYDAVGFCALLIGLLLLPHAASAQTGGAQAAVDQDKACTTCHDADAAGHILAIYQTRHGNRADSRTPGCRVCHGQSDAHIRNNDIAPEVVFGDTSKHLSPVATRNATCLTCHGKSVLPQPLWTGSSHETRGVACTNCHNVHAADQKVLTRATQGEVCFTCHKTQRGQIRKLSNHPLAVDGLGDPPKMVCADCHNVHGSIGPTLLQKASVNETCYVCHADRRGPFLWEHAPVAENCATCHTPHGSSNPSLLKTRPPYLCQQCHSGDHGAQVNSAGNLAGGNVVTVNGAQAPAAAAPRAQLSARACLNCHVLVHGSNNPAGSKYQR